LIVGSTQAGNFLAIKLLKKSLYHVVLYYVGQISWLCLALYGSSPEAVSLIEPCEKHVCLRGCLEETVPDGDATPCVRLRWSFVSGVLISVKLAVLDRKSVV
jgi:hypothetical protein